MERPELVITQRENLSGTARSLRLIGSVAPVDRLVFGGVQRGEVTWNPGTSIATVRLDGPAEDETSFEFRWRSHLFRVGEARVSGLAGGIAEDSDIPSIEALIDTLESFRRASALVDVYWRGRKHVGYLARSSYTEALAGVVDASLEFAWVAPPDAVLDIAPDVPTSPQGYAAKLVSIYESGMADAQALLDEVNGGITFARTGLESVADAVSRVRETVYQIQTAARSFKDLGRDWAGIQKSMGDGIEQMGMACKEVNDALKLTAPDLAQSDDAELQIRAGAYQARVGRTVRDLRHAGMAERRAYRYESDLLGWHTVVGDETVFQVAALWYKDSSKAYLIRRRNHLWKTQLRPGQRLAIPRLEPPRGR